jgi:hypothetical protein
VTEAIPGICALLASQQRKANHETDPRRGSNCREATLELVADRQLERLQRIDLRVDLSKDDLQRLLKLTPVGAPLRPYEIAN